MLRAIHPSKYHHRPTKRKRENLNKKVNSNNQVFERFFVSNCKSLINLGSDVPQGFHLEFMFHCLILFLWVPFETMRVMRNGAVSIIRAYRRKHTPVGTRLAEVKTLNNRSEMSASNKRLQVLSWLYVSTSFRRPA